VLHAGFLLGVDHGGGDMFLLKTDWLSVG
jgi:hypothetical protein